MRATPRTALTQPQTIQPMKAETITAHSVPAQIATGTARQSTASPAGRLSSTTGRLPASVA